MNLSEIQYLRSFLQKKVRESENKFLLEGWRPLRDALESKYHIEMIAVVLPALAKPEPQRILALAKKRGIQVKEIKEVQIKKISDTVHSQGVVALIHQERKTFRDADIQSEDFIVACDRINDPGNLGTILRTCDWFGVQVVLLGEGCVSIYNEKVLRATAGSVFHLNIFEHINLGSVCEDLRFHGFSVIATAMEGEPLNGSTWTKKNVLIMGSEAHGVHADLVQKAGRVLHIPRFGQAESLNVGVACGIILAQWRKSSIR